MDKFPVINWHTRTFDQKQTGEEEYTPKILQFRPLPPAALPEDYAIPKQCLTVPFLAGEAVTPPQAKQESEAADQRRETEAALKMDGHILLAWAVCKYGGRVEIISAYYLPEEGKQWVYKWEYDKKTMKAVGSFSRIPRHDAYQWLKEAEPKGIFREIHVCAPPYILLDSKDLRKEYLAGNLKTS
jgi:hypothetical protein